VTALFALASAVLVGGADFVGGFTSRRAPAVVVAGTAQALGLLVGIPVALVYGFDALGAADVLFSLLSGALVGIGLVLFYAAMSGGLISLAAPVAAVVGALLPATVGLARGERPGTAALVGIPLALVAVAIVSLAPEEATAPAKARASRAVALAVAAGVLFGLFFVVLAEVSEDAGMWPVPLQRLMSTLVLVPLALALRAPLLAAARSVATAALSIAALEVSATVFLLLALQRGPLAVAAVLASLYPVTTVLLAAAVVGERLSRVQLSGVVLALVSVALVSAG
jgi:drug/metabolite transporter (DMT)-like permease